MVRCRWHKDENGNRFLNPGCWNRAVYGDYAECHCPKPEPRKMTCPTCGQPINNRTQWHE